MRKREILWGKKERLDERVKFACFLEKGRTLLDDEEELMVNTKISYVMRRIRETFAK